MDKNIKKIEKILKDLKPILRDKYNISEIGVFGSYVRGEQKSGSDLDILVEFDESASFGLFKFIEMENYLSDQLGIKVDLVMKDSLKPRIGEVILKEVITI
ncbi:nucleotidyltransferase family protein [Patescibacteria group bacterium]|nr:nucleotidyltransferase family protein [Patescibacteria group bacterium]